MGVVRVTGGTREIVVTVAFTFSVIVMVSIRTTAIRTTRTWFLHFLHEVGPDSSTVYGWDAQPVVAATTVTVLSHIVIAGLRTGRGLHDAVKEASVARIGIP